uniref:Heme exporter protein B n=1 Tax=Candidatus Kentrum sp. MB TaxID=2138164 RepID=A0A450XTI0_9GAMM|nr:MAG: heme exporter protein B [Candidatus Kentron sp. MB]VFK35388.1 MAG: heme exporter protein B [Candidatus Kentron sp. MB]VFK77273.1 MAG: heme exporter protein B [Candidatus Kentron sp. MB]
MSDSPLLPFAAWRAFLALLRRDLLLAMRRRNELVNPLLFFVLVVTLFAMGVRAEEHGKVLAIMAPGVIWVAALLASLLSLEGMFRSDFEDGSLEQILLSPFPIVFLVFAKVLAHWLVTGFPLILLAPLLGILMSLPVEAMGTLFQTLLLGTPVLSLAGAIGVSLTVGLRRGGALLSLLVLPLYIPVLLFAAKAVGDSALGLSIAFPMKMLGAMLLLWLALGPVATAAALKISVD